MTRLCLLLAVLLVARTQSFVDDTNTDCHSVCYGGGTVHDTLYTFCGCQLQGHHTQQPIVKTTTLSMCDYLCSIQMGGSACDCSIPIFPGRK